MKTTQARPSDSGNAMVWVNCKCGRKFTVRKSKLASLPPCEKCERIKKGCE